MFVCLALFRIYTPLANPEGYLVLYFDYNGVLLCVQIIYTAGVHCTFVMFLPYNTPHRWLVREVPWWSPRVLFPVWVLDFGGEMGVGGMKGDIERYLGVPYSRRSKLLKSFFRVINALFYKKFGHEFFLGFL